MQNLQKHSFLRARLAVAIVVALIAAGATLLGAIIGYAAATYQARHNDANIVAGQSAEGVKFEAANSTRSKTFEITPCNGKLHVAAKQTSGKTDANRPYYSVSMKKTSASSYTSYVTALTFTNTNWSREYPMMKVSKGTKYAILFQKYLGYKYDSVLNIDFLVK